MRRLFGSKFFENYLCIVSICYLCLTEGLRGALTIRSTILVSWRSRISLHGCPNVINNPFRPCFPILTIAQVITYKKHARNMPALAFKNAEKPMFCVTRCARVLFHFPRSSVIGLAIENAPVVHRQRLEGNRRPTRLCR